ncbi:MAG: sulfotransferase [Yoonia sp.]|nr:sulfotransferase [Yoonia sp.]
MGSPSDQPALIVGFPRSGSTLLEQMLTNHSQIASVGESPALPILCQSVGMRSHNGADMVAAIRQIPKSAALDFASRYQAETAG